jgi:diaminobutyrate-2-oxoglutarate transaminase
MTRLSCSPRPHVTGTLPGPRSAELLARQERRESNARVYPRHFPFAIAEASGSFIRDLDGNVFIDFLSGAGVLSLGHNHPELVAAVTEQLGVLTHGLDMPTPAKDAFTEAQLFMLPESMRDRMKIHFCGPTGANAVEAALKLCKTATGRADVVSFQGGFHGGSHAAMALTGNVSQKRPIAGGMPGVHFFPFSSCSRCPLALNPETCETNCVGFLERALTDPNGGIPLPAAVVMEMVQGEGGVNPARTEFARRVRELTRRLDIPLVVDEVQTGCGRTGTWFAFEQYDIEPDVIIASKALSGIGQPVAIVIYDKKLDVWAPGAHTGTFRGNQLAFAAGAATVRIMRRDNILSNVRARGAQVAARLAELRDHPGVREVRGRGLMWGIELADPGDGRSITEAAERVQARALRGGLIVELGGRDDRVVRMLPPLNVTEEVMDTALDILLDAIDPNATAPARVTSGERRRGRTGAGATSRRTPDAPVTVWKFGGTSVADHDRLRAAARRMVEAQRSGRRVVAVLSAMGKATDELSEMAYRMSARPPLRELDALLSVGESISCALAGMAIHELGSRAVSFNGAQAGIHTDRQHGNARLRQVRPERIVEALDDGAVALVTGFQGISEDGAVTTLGRGGSDASAIALAAALGVGECEIFTDVPAVFTADPRVVPDARPLVALCHQEMLEMARAGAGVLQPQSVQLAAAHGVDIHLRSSFSTEDGTWIRKDRETDALEGHGVVGVAHREDLGTVSVIGIGIGRRPEITARARRALEAAGIRARRVTTRPGRVSVHVAAERVPGAARLLHATFITGSTSAEAEPAAAVAREAA